MALSSWGAKRLHYLRESLWFLPLLLGGVGVGLGFLLPMLDRRLPGSIESLAPAPSPAESLISTGAGALATILGVAFSLTVVTLQLATQQYSSRLLRRFMADRLTRWVLGSYLGTIAFLTLVLRSIQPAQDGHAAFVPAVAVWLGMALFIACVMMLAVFIHYLARSIQASTIVASVGKDTLHTLHTLGLDSEQSAPTSLQPLPGPAGQVVAKTPGYLQLVDEQALLEAAPEGCTLMRVEARTGQFLLPGKTLLSAWPAEAVDEAAADRIRKSFALGSERTAHQDVLYGIRQLVDIALKALSPAMNDVTTALMVVNELGAVVHRVATSEQGIREGDFRAIRRERVTLLLPRLDLETVLVHTFDELPRAASDHPMVLARLLEVLAELEELAPDAYVRQKLLESSERVHQFVQQTQLAKWEQDLLRRRFVDVKEGHSDTQSDPTNPI